MALNSFGLLKPPESHPSTPSLGAFLDVKQKKIAGVSFIFRGYNPYIGGSKPSFFHGFLGSKGNG